MRSTKKILCALVASASAILASGALFACSDDTHVHNWSEWEITEEATCTESGLMTRTCGSHKQEKVIDPLGHDWDIWTIETAATEEKAGERRRECKNDRSHFETQTIPMLEHSHDYKTPSYVWSADKTSCTATRVCGKDSSHIDTETVTAVEKETKAPTCTEEGIVTLTATFTKNVFTKQTETKSIDALNHDYGNPSYVWNADDTVCTATVTCSHDKLHTLSYDSVEVISSVETATCTVKGHTLLTAKFEQSTGIADETKRVNETDYADHDYDEVSYVWSADKTTCTATRVCKNDETHIDTETVTAVKSETKTPTCTEDGENTFTATFTNDGFVEQTETATVDPIGHDYDEVSYVWSADKTTCTAIIVCGNNSAHTLEYEAEITSVVTAPTCIAKGYTTLTATFAEDGLEKQTAVIDETEIDENAHDWGDWSLTSNPSISGDEGSQTRTCLRDGSHVENKRAVMLTVGGESYLKSAQADSYTVVLADSKFTLTLGGGANIADIAVYGANVEIVSDGEGENTASNISVQRGYGVEFSGATKLTVGNVAANNGNVTAKSANLFISGDGSADPLSVTDGALILADGASVTVGFTGASNGKSAISSVGITVGGGSTLNVAGGVFNIYMNGDVNVEEGGALSLSGAEQTAIGSYADHTIYVDGAMTVSGMTQGSAIWFDQKGTWTDNGGNTHKTGVLGSVFCNGTLDTNNMQAVVGTLNLNGQVSVGRVECSTLILDDADADVKVNGVLYVIGNVDEALVKVAQGKLTVNCNESSEAVFATHIVVGTESTSGTFIVNSANKDAITLETLGQGYGVYDFINGTVSLNNNCDEPNNTGICLNKGGNSTVNVGSDMTLSFTNYGFTLGTWWGHIEFNNSGTVNDGGGELKLE